MMIDGKYRRGCGRAHFSSSAHESYFGCPMVGTFNVRTKVAIDKFAPTIEREGRRYWRLKINGKYEAWAFRWDRSKMPKTTWELVSKEPLPNALRHRSMEIEMLEA